MSKKASFAVFLCILISVFLYVCLMSAMAYKLPAGTPFIVQSHRGAGNLAPENTLPTFQYAWRIGTVPEADVRATSDGVIVAFHDYNFARLAPNVDPQIRSKSTGALEWSVVSAIDVGSYKGQQYKDQRIPKISDVFDKMRGRPGCWLYLDVKEVPLKQLAAIAREKGVERQVILASAKYEQVCEWKQLLPESNTLLWMGDKEPKLRERIAELKKNNFAGVTQLQIHVNVQDLSAADPFAPSSEFLREVGKEVHSRGILYQVLVKNSNNPEAYKKLMDLGIESFASDDPLIALHAMREYANSHRK